MHVTGTPQRFTREQLEAHVSERLDRVFGLIRARVALGFLRYESNRGRSPCYLEWLEQSLAEYRRTRNIDALLDVAFYAVAEFQDPSMEGTFYRAEKEERNER
jgi:hypothetical protein